MSTAQAAETPGQQQMPASQTVPAADGRPTADDASRIAHALAHRVDRVMLVLEGVADNGNHLACLRTLDILGVQNCMVISTAAGAGQQKQQQQQQEESAGTPQQQPGRKKTRISRAASQWLDVEHVAGTAEAVRRLRAGGWAIWATDLTPGAHSLAEAGLRLPPKLAVVLGSESGGISQEMRDAADRCVYLPQFGFTESFNVSVAAALVLQTLIAADPGLRGALVGGEARAVQLEAKWRAACARAHDNRAGAVQRACHAGQAAAVAERRLAKQEAWQAQRQRLLEVERARCSRRHEAQQPAEEPEAGAARQQQPQQQQQQCACADGRVADRLQRLEIR